MRLCRFRSAVPLFDERKLQVSSERVTKIALTSKFRVLYTSAQSCSEAMTSQITREMTERPSMSDANETWLNFSDYDTAFLDQRSADDEKIAVDEDELLFYFALYKITVPTAFGIIILVGLLGNLLVIGVTLSRHKMWTTVNLLLLNPHLGTLKESGCLRLSYRQQVYIPLNESC